MFYIIALIIGFILAFGLLNLGKSFTGIRETTTITVTKSLTTAIITPGTLPRPTMTYITPSTPPLTPGVNIIEMKVNRYNISIRESKYIFNISITYVSNTKLRVMRIRITPLILPYGWNGSTWVLPSDINKCEIMLSNFVQYICTFSQRDIITNSKNVLEVYVYVHFLNKPFGKYILNIEFNNKCTIALPFTTPDYIEPSTPPPSEIIEQAKHCGYSQLLHHR